MLLPDAVKRKVFEKGFLNKEKKGTWMKISPWVSANRPSNNKVPDFYDIPFKAFDLRTYKQNHCQTVASKIGCKRPEWGSYGLKSDGGVYNRTKASETGRKLLKSADYV